ncbi:hypothetical protein BDB01DRAFT_775328 [Pilobolus umbonatus]|nr:hypothetical protein BDB01DRAFT_775328 [Pilobolus umbonatus]
MSKSAHLNHTATLIYIFCVFICIYYILVSTHIYMHINSLAASHSTFISGVYYIYIEYTHTHTHTHTHLYNVLFLVTRKQPSYYGNHGVCLSPLTTMVN